MADRFSGANEGVRTGVWPLGVGDVMALRPAHAWWAPVGTVHPVAGAAHVSAWGGPADPGDWVAVARRFRDDHTAT